MTNFVARALQVAETQAADANVLTFTPPARTGTYRVVVAATVKTVTGSLTVGFTVAYTDSNGSAVADTAVSIFQLGTAAPANTFAAAAQTRYYGFADILVNNGAVAVIVKWVGGGTGTADVSVTIEQIG